MAANFVVQADVVDIRVDAPRKTDAFVVDTNVWYCVAYTKATPLPHQKANYPIYLKNALTVGAGIFRYALSQAELLHNIEKTEYELFKAAHPLVRPKEFRHNFPPERAQVVNECNIAWHLLKILAKPLDAQVQDQCTDAALTRFQTQPLDGYDLYLLEAMHHAKLTQVLSDDGDFCTVPGIQLFTANQNVINAAKAQGKLLVR